MLITLPVINEHGRIIAALYAAQSEAQALLEQDPALQSEENAPLRAAAQRLFAEKTALN